MVFRTVNAARVPLTLCGALIVLNVYLYTSGAFVDVQALLEAICFPALDTLHLRGALGFSGQIMTLNPHADMSLGDHVRELVSRWSPDMSWALAYADAIRLVHLAGVALGLGTVVSVALSLRPMLEKGLDRQMLAFVRRSHAMIAAAIVVLWVAGLALIGIRTGFDPAAFSPKLITKLVVVTVLTIDALLMGLCVSPVLARHSGQSLKELSVPERLLLANCAALSGASWLYALMLGASSVLKTAQTPLLILVGVVIYGTAYTLATAFTLRLAGVRTPLPRGHAVHVRYEELLQQKLAKAI